MAKKSASKSKKTTISVDFTDVETAGKLPEGDHLFTVESVEEKESGEGNPYLSWKLKTKGGSVYHTTSLMPHALWNLKGTLEACGYEVPSSSFDFDPADLVGAQLGGTVEKEEYQGKKRSRVVDVFPAEELEEAEEEEEEEEEQKKPAKGKKEKTSKPAKKGKTLKVGSKVEWEDDGDTYEGKVVSIDDDVYTVEDSDGDEWELDKEDLTLA